MDFIKRFWFACIILLWVIPTMAQDNCTTADTAITYQIATDTLKFIYNMPELACYDTTKFDQYKWLFDLVDELIKADSLMIEKIFIDQKIQYRTPNMIFGYRQNP